MTMLTSIRNERLKLTSTRLPWLILGIAQLLVVGGISGKFVSGSDPNDPQTLLIAFSHVGLASVLSLVLGIMAVAGEYRYRTITDTYLATPSRGVVVGAKVATYGAFGALIGVVSAATALATAAVWLNVKDSVLTLGADGVWKTIVGCIVWNACFGALGVGVGALVRNLVGAIAGALVWIAIVEGLVAQLIGDNGKWLAFRSGVALEGIASPGVALLPQWGGGLMLLVYTGAIVAVALATSMRRDVT